MMKKKDMVYYIHFLCRGFLRHVIDFKGYARVKRLRNTALGGCSLRERGVRAID